MGHFPNWSSDTRQISAQSAQSFVRYLKAAFARAHVTDATRTCVCGGHQWIAHGLVHMCAKFGDDSAVGRGVRLVSRGPREAHLTAGECDLIRNAVHEWGLVSRGPREAHLTAGECDLIHNAVHDNNRQHMYLFCMFSSFGMP